MDHFAAALAFTLRWEGGAVDHPDDPGGRTKFGISKRAYPELDIGALTLEDAKRIYRRDYWDRIRADDLPGPVAIAAFDYAVHSGAHKEGRAIRDLQRSVDAKADGVVGPKTLAHVADSVQLMAPERLALALVERRARFLARLIRRRPDQVVFLEGWWARLVDLAGYVHVQTDLTPRGTTVAQGGEA